MVTKSNVSMSSLKVVKAEAGSLILVVSGSDHPLTLAVTSYERGVVIHIPWWSNDKLGSPGYQALKAVLRGHYQGAIETRTEVDPRFSRAAAARGESVRQIVQSAAALPAA